MSRSLKGSIVCCETANKARADENENLANDGSSNLKQIQTLSSYFTLSTFQFSLVWTVLFCLHIINIIVCGVFGLINMLAASPELYPQMYGLRIPQRVFALSA